MLSDQSDFRFEILNSSLSDHQYKYISLVFGLALEPLALFSVFQHFVYYYHPLHILLLQLNQSAQSVFLKCYRHGLEIYTEIYPGPLSKSELGLSMRFVWSLVSGLLLRLTLK